MSVCCILQQDDEADSESIAHSSDMREKLNQAEDNNRQLALRKEIESKTFQERIDKLVSCTAFNPRFERTLLNASLVFQDLGILFYSRNSRRRSNVSRTPRTTSSRPRSPNRGKGGEARNLRRSIIDGRGEAGRTVEEQLQVTVAELRAELRSTKDELERAQKHVKQYQAIAETEGDSLRELTATYEEYKSSTEASLTEKDVSSDFCFLSSCRAE